jgi:IS4 transposase
MKQQEGGCGVAGTSRDFAGVRSFGNSEEQADSFVLPAFTITELYRCRWQVELFFKWIKQHLRIKAFFGTSENAVRSQIRIAVSAYVLVAIVKKRLQLSASLYEILQILSVTMFEKSRWINYSHKRSANKFSPFPVTN